MKEIVVISGKGGTGKTSITAAFASLAENAVFADCDVDAADLHLILSPEILVRNTFVSGQRARIDPALCTRCGMCKELCRFEAVIINAADGTYHIETEACEGCAVCSEFCPAKAVIMEETECGEWYISNTRFGPMVHAQLHIGAENSGKLVTIVRKDAKKKAAEIGADMIIVDGSPGVGCPVIASITGASAVVAVTEPTMSGKHDLLRVISLARHFRVPLYACVNKWDINPVISGQIEEECIKANVVFLGNVSYDKSITAAQIAGKSIIEYGDSQTAGEIRAMWEKLCQKI